MLKTVISICFQVYVCVIVMMLLEVQISLHSLSNGKPIWTTHHFILWFNINQSHPMDLSNIVTMSTHQHCPPWIQMFNFYTDSIQIKQQYISRLHLPLRSCPLRTFATRSVWFGFWCHIHICKENKIAVMNKKILNIKRTNILSLVISTVLTARFPCEMSWPYIENTCCML